MPAKEVYGTTDEAIYTTSGGSVFSAQNLISLFWTAQIHKHSYLDDDTLHQTGIRILNPTKFKGLVVTDLCFFKITITLTSYNTFIESVSLSV